MGPFKRIHLVLLNAGLLACTSFAGDNCIKYLVMSGPTPLRFQAPMPQYDPAKVLPPLKMSDEPTAVAVEAVESGPKSTVESAPAITTTPVQEPVKTQQPITEPVQQVHPIQEPVAPIETNVPKSESSQVTPQMLLRYFKGDANKEVVVPAAVEFTPPAPASSSGRSSATYLSPAAK